MVKHAAINHNKARHSRESGNPENYWIPGQARNDNRHRTHVTRYKMERNGFTLIEILLVISIIGLMLSVTLPMSYNMYNSYKASLKAEEVLIFVSTLKRESFLYSEAKILSSKEGVMTVNGKEKTFNDILVQVDPPVEFYRNGTTSGGTVRINVGDQAYSLNVQAPFGELFLERKG